ncbi:hypothetical protein, partial [Escherichia coli]|uniref:hypothetical protein n=1 Tax=Escherichia coli TaxID=562 RepID=UPI001BDB8D02
KLESLPASGGRPSTSSVKRNPVDIATSSKMNNDPYRTTADNVISGTTSDVIREGTENAMVM